MLIISQEQLHSNETVRMHPTYDKTGTLRTNFRMYVCMCVCVCVCVCVCACMHACMRVCMLYVCMYVCKYAKGMNQQLTVLNILAKKFVSSTMQIFHMLTEKCVTPFLIQPITTSDCTILPFGEIPKPT